MAFVVTVDTTAALLIVAVESVPRVALVVSRVTVNVRKNIQLVLLLPESKLVPSSAIISLVAKESFTSVLETDSVVVVTVHWVPPLDERRATRVPVAWPLSVSVVNVYVVEAAKRNFVEAVTALNVLAVVAAEKITEGEASGSEPEELVTVSVLKAEPLVMVPASVCCAAPASVTVPELCVKVPLFE